MPQKIKKMLFLTVDFPPMGGGMSRHSFDVALALRQLKEPVVIAAPQAGRDKDVIAEVGFSVVRLPGIVPGRIFDNYLRSVVIFFLYGFYYCVSRRVKAVVVNTWSIAGVAAFLIKKTLGIPYFVFAHGLDVYAPLANPKVYHVMRVVLKNASLVIANSNCTAGLVKRVVGEREKIEVLHPVIDTKRFTPQPSFFDKKIADKKVILTVARLVESKGHEAVIRALPRIIQHIPRLLYKIVGEGPLEQRLKELVDTLGLGDKVAFVGNVQDNELAAYYASCDVFVMISREIKERGEVEGFGIVFLEAGACARPVVGAKSGGVPDAVIDGVTGILVDPLNEEEIARAIIRILQDEPLAKSLGENGKRRVETELTIENFADKLKRIINNNG
ncbi:MAG: hypothetical protein A2Y00_07365 [Omnitrophica WOR_2 bacterium GWF2_43_52]|nr:MAG: hypothetical protein A2Y01_01045 [Omnitrophica WOR_2 bacterium GWC2_44_8]OGX20238.1 MAG: hypothetical protein A2Y00_07365 [Omnitrophica WOR_2 bacterium GWF2_43_52]HAH20742.1 hypothetical protein [Candidatus Omnitrophota bacterium]HBG63610.1 hypothetical protein [Candidatus Omnitrophota bacterium]HCD39017.1 hypothetical protein [Candidatus Omnitrophota bacterium]